MDHQTSLREFWPLTSNLAKYYPSNTSKRKAKPANQGEDFLFVKSNLNSFHTLPFGNYIRQLFFNKENLVLRSLWEHLTWTGKVICSVLG